jgi:eukaryotic-like serine/threonine-protein kinase
MLLLAYSFSPSSWLALPPEMLLRPGMIVGGKYRLERALGHGGMGRLWVARHAQLGSSLAVKFLAPKFAASPVFRARFEREARAAANLKCPQVVHVQDYGFEGDAPYLVMELLEGEDLNQRLTRSGRMSLDDAAKVVSHTGKALRKAHEAGIVHRDIKPANLFLARVGEEEIVKVLDFGIAKEIATPSGETTSTGELLGSPHYMSPEQCSAVRDIDARADLWSLGVILFRMLTGRLPFPGNQMTTVITKILTESAPSATELAPDLPPAFDAFFKRALARDRSQRFQSIGELEQAFRAAMGRGEESLRISVTPPVRPSAPPVVWPQPQAAPALPSPGLTTRHRSAVLVIIAVVFLLGVATGVLFFRRSPAVEPEPALASVSAAAPPAPPETPPAPASAAPEPSLLAAPEPSPEPEPSFEVVPEPSASVAALPPAASSGSSSGSPAPKHTGGQRTKPGTSAIPMRDKWF